MNKENFHEWKNNPITVQIFTEITNAAQDVLERSKIRDTSDKTAMQVAHDEGFLEGIEAFVASVEDMELEVKDEN